MGAIVDIVHGGLLEAWAHLSDGFWTMVITVAALIGVDLKNLFVRWRLERRLERGIDLAWDDVQYLKARIEAENEIKREFKPREALRNMLAHAAGYLGLGLVFAIGKALGAPLASVGLFGAAALWMQGYLTLTRELPDAIDAIDADALRAKGHMFVIFGCLIAAFSVYALFS